MEVSRIDDVEEFLARSEAFCADEPYLTNMITTTATLVASRSRTYGHADWWVVEESDRVVGVMMMTAPHHLVLSPMPESGLALSARRVLDGAVQIPGVNGPASEVETFIALLATHDASYASPRLERSMHVYVLGSLRPSSGVGLVHQCTENDFDVVLDWWIDARREMDINDFGIEESLRSAVTGGRVYTLVRDDEMVCTVGHSPFVRARDSVVVRIGPVYTPPTRRGNGFATSLTGSVCSLLSERDARVMLFADAANATSNGIYRALGFDQIAALVEYGF